MRTAHNGPCFWSNQLDALPDSIMQWPGLCVSDARGWPIVVMGFFAQHNQEGTVIDQQQRPWYQHDHELMQTMISTIPGEEGDDTTKRSSRMLLVSGSPRKLRYYHQQPTGESK